MLAAGHQTCAAWQDKDQCDNQPVITVLIENQAVVYNDGMTNTANHPLPKLGYTRIEAAAIIGQSPATIDRLTRRGLLRPSRATRRPIYTLRELERFMQATTAEVQP